MTGTVPYRRLSAYYAFYFALLGIFTPYFSLYLQSLSFTGTDIAVVMGGVQLMRIAGPNIWGWLADRYHRQMPLVTFLSIMGLLVLSLLFQVDSVANITVVVAISVFFWSGALPLFESVALSYLGEQTMHYGKMRAWGSVGFIAAVLSLGYLLDMSSPDILLPAMLVVLLAGVVCSALIRDKPRITACGTVVSFCTILRQRRVQVLLTACFLITVAHSILYVFYSIHLVASGYSKTFVGWMWTMGVCAEIVLFINMPLLIKKIGFYRLFLVAFVAGAIRFLLIGWGVEYVIGLFIAQLLHGLTFGASHAVAIAWIHQWFQGRTQARGQALYNSLSFGAGGMIGAAIAGVIWEFLGAGWTFTIASLCSLTGLLLIYLWLKPESTHVHVQ